MNGHNNLLAATGSFMDLPERPRRLRSVAEGFLPNFGSTPALRATVRARLGGGLGPLFDGQAEPGAAGQMEATPPAPAVPETVTPEGTGAHPLPSKPWTRARYEPAKLIEGLLRAGSLGRKGSWRTRRRAVQGELAFAKIQVVRNDLHDTDFELVPAQAKDLTDAPAGQGEDGGRRRFGLRSLSRGLGGLWRRFAGGVARRARWGLAQRRGTGAGLGA
jgi:hypothetical protein